MPRWIVPAEKNRIIVFLGDWKRRTWSKIVGGMYKKFRIKNSKTLFFVHCLNIVVDLGKASTIFLLSNFWHNIVCVIFLDYSRNTKIKDTLWWWLQISNTITGVWARLTLQVPRMWHTQYLSPSGPHTHFLSEPGVADEILENEPKSCLTVA